MFDTPSIRELAGNLARLQFALYERRSGNAIVDRSMAGIHINVDPKGVTPYLSSNVNGAEPLPGGEGWTPDLPANLRKYFAAAGVEKFFFWLSSGPTADRIEADVLAAGYQRFPWVEYRVLARPPAASINAATALTVRRFDRSRDGDAIANFPDAKIRGNLLDRAQNADEEFYVA